MKKNVLFLLLGILLGLIMGIGGAWSVCAQSVRQAADNHVKYFQRAGDMARAASLYKAKSNLYYLGLCREKRYSELETAMEKGVAGDMVMAGDLCRSRDAGTRNEYEKIARLFKSYYLMKGVPVPMDAPLDLFLQDTPPGDPAAFKAFMEKPDL